MDKARRFSASVLALLAVATASASPPLPTLTNATFPRRLSEAGLFADVRKLTPGATMLNYDLNLPFWSDGANKTRWIVPVTDNSKRIRFDATGEWSFPEGTIFVKHFDLPVDSRNRAVVRRLETRLLVCNATGGVYGVTYKWRPDNSDAELLATNLLEDIPIQTESGTHTQSWYYPSQIGRAHV